MVKSPRRRRVFISYARVDIGAALYLERKLRAEFDTWMDKKDILPGQDYDNTIVRELRAAHAVVVLWSNESARSGWVHSEASAAKVLGKLIPVCITKTAIPQEFQYPQALEWLGWELSENDGALDRLIQAVREARPLETRPFGSRRRAVIGASLAAFAVGMTSAGAALWIVGAPSSSGTVATHAAHLVAAPEAPAASNGIIEQIGATLQGQAVTVDATTTAPPLAPPAERQRESPVKRSRSPEPRTETRPNPPQPSESVAASGDADGGGMSETVVFGEPSPPPPSTLLPSAGAGGTASDLPKRGGKIVKDATRIK